MPNQLECLSEDGDLVELVRTQEEDGVCTVFYTCDGCDRIYRQDQGESPNGLTPYIGPLNEGELSGNVGNYFGNFDRIDEEAILGENSTEERFDPEERVLQDYSCEL